MADTLDITAGAGTTIATDDVGGIHFQEIKLVDGTKDSSTPIAVDVGVKANALRIAPANDITDGTYIGDIKFGEAEPNSAAILADTTAILADTAAIQTAVELIDNAVDGSYLNCNLNIAGTDVSANAGVLTAQTLRVTIATDDEVNNLLGTIDADTSIINTNSGTIAGDTTSIDGKVTACNTGAVVLSSGTVTTVSTVTNLSQMGGAALNMGEGVINTGTQRVTLATDDDGVAHLATIAGAVSTQMQCDIVAALPVGANAIGKLAANSGVDIGDVDVTSVPAPLNVVGGGTEAAALRVTIANDSTGVLTVDGTVTANLSAIDNAVLDTIDTVLDAINAKLVTGTVIGDVNLGATDNAVIDTIATNTGNATTALQIVDDWDATHASAAPADGACIMGAAYSAGLPADVGADADAARICTDRYGRVLPGIMPQKFNAVYDSADATGEGETVKAATASRKIYILSCVISSDVEGWIKLQDEDSNALTGRMWLKAGGGMSLTWPDSSPLVLDTVNKALEVIAEAAGNVSVTVTGYLAV